MKNSKVFHPLSLVTDEEVINEAAKRLQKLYLDSKGVPYRWGRMLVDFIDNHVVGVMTENGETVFKNASFTSVEPEPA